ncbi:hypothetical protein BDAP_002227 [Binucleata daphniae]
MPEYNLKTDNELEIILEQIRNKLTQSCKRCGSEIKISTARDNIAICKNKLCTLRYNIYENTIFYHMQLEKKLILQILEMWMFKDSFGSIRKNARISSKTLWALLTKLRAEIVYKFYESFKNWR